MLAVSQAEASARPPLQGCPLPLPCTGRKIRGVLPAVSACHPPSLIGQSAVRVRRR